jgi:hypothetical protein
MKKPIENINPKGRYLGVFVLVVIQLIVGIIHTFFGFTMVLGIYSVVSVSTAPMVYSYYTLAYGLLTLFFAFLFWIGKRLGWIGTIGISIFVIFVDILAVFSLFNVLGIPKLAGLGEVPYSLFILFYLFEDHIRLKYSI